MRIRLRPAYTPEQLAEVYKTPHQSNRWRDHIIRVRATAALGAWFGNVERVADLSCGDGFIARQLCADPILGDYAPGYRIHGPLEQTLLDLRKVDLYVCSETIEHLDNPDLVLRLIRERTDGLLLSTPIGETGTGNPEHYWGWDVEGVREMLTEAGFTPEVQLDLRFPGMTYDYQIWACS